MKKIILAIIAVMTVGLVSAQEQTKKGKYLIEGNTSFGATGTGNTGFALNSEDGTTTWNIGAEGGYFVMDNLAVKLGLGYGDQGHDMSMFSYKVGAKYYVINKIPVELSYTGASIKNANENPSYLGIQGGYAWFVGNNISIEPGLRYNITLNENYGKDVLQFNIGFALHF